MVLRLRPEARDDLYAASDSSHPYPVELDLPSWTVAVDIDLRSWLFAFGGGIRTESPDALRQELVDRCRESIGSMAVGSQVQSLLSQHCAAVFPIGCVVTDSVTASRDQIPLSI